MILTEHRTYDSRNIKESVYDFNTKDLILTFKGGNKYKYMLIDIDVYKQFSTAESIGQEFHKIIKDIYEFEKLD